MGNGRPLAVRDPDVIAAARHAIAPEATPGPAAELLSSTLRNAIARVEINRPGLLDPKATEPVHQMRVGLRRYRMILAGYRPLFEASWVDDLRTRTCDLAAPLGRLRDRDIVAMRLKADVESLEAGESGRALLVAVESERRDARDNAVRHFEDRTTRAVLSELARAAEAPRLGEGVDEDAVMARADRSWRRLRTLVRALDEPSYAELHRVRIATKRARYVVEAAAPFARKSTDRFVDAACELQGALGELQDAVITQTWLLTATRDVPAADAFLAGRLAQIEAAAGARVASTWRSSWKKLATERNLRWRPR